MVSNPDSSPKGGLHPVHGAGGKIKTDGALEKVDIPGDDGPKRPDVGPGPGAVPEPGNTAAGAEIGISPIKAVSGASVYNSLVPVITGHKPRL